LYAYHSTMKTFTTFLMLLFFILQAHSQPKKIDSLNNLINKATTDTARINLIIKQIRLVSAINLDTAINLGKKALEEAQKIKYYRGEIDVRQGLASNYCFKGEFKAAEHHLRFLEHFILPSKDSTDLANIYANFGMMYGIQSRYDSSIYFYEKAIVIGERSEKKTSKASNYSNIAIAYQQQSNFSQALFYQQKALKIAEENQDEVDQAYTYMNMANTYSDLDDSVRAEQNFLKAIELARKTGTANVELYGYSNLATLYMKGEKWQRVYEFAMKAATLGGAMGDQGIHAASMSKAAIALAYTNKFKDALSLAKRAILIADSSSQPLSIFQANSTMATVLKLQGNCKEAIPYYEKGFLSLEASDIYTASNGEAYLELSECFEQIGDHEKALGAYKTSSQISDSVRRKENIRKATELTMNYEFEKKQQVQQTEQKSKDAVAAAKQLALMVGLGLTLVLAVVAFIGFRNKQKANALLKQQKEEIHSTLTRLKSTQSQLIQSEKMASLGELTGGIAHEIENPLNFVNNFSEVNKELLAEMGEEIDKGNFAEVKIIANNVITNGEKIIHHGKRADAIVKNMLQHSRGGSGVKEPTDINALAEEYLRLAYHGVRAKDKSFNASLKTDFDKSIGNISVIPQDIGRAILNMINNAFYAVTEKNRQNGDGYQPTVTMITRKLGDKVLISVKDNGNGIPQKILDKIFQPFFTTKPTGQGTGLGLSLSYDIVKAHGGELNVDTKEGHGSEFIVTLPV
jgi:two-component system NtrC family sensor kinase